MILSELHAPCGILKCSDKYNNFIPFRSIPIDKTYDTAVYDEIQSDWVKVVPEYQATIAIDTSNLQVGDTYTLCLYDINEYQFGAYDTNDAA